jgi:hypothetical protein
MEGGSKQRVDAGRAARGFPGWQGSVRSVRVRFVQGRRMHMTAAALGRLAVLLLAVVALGGCGGGDNEGAATDSETTKESTTTTPSEGMTWTNENWATVVSDPGNYEGDSVNLVGRVFSVERNEDAVGLQVWMDAKNSDQNTIVGYGDPAFQVAEDDYVRVTGTVGEKFEGENAFGGTLVVPTVKADTLEVVDASVAATPAHTTYGPATFAQAGIRMTVTKIEAAPDETRIYVSVRNQSAYDFSFYSSSAKLVANGQSIKSSYSGDYKEPASDIPTDSRTSGVILFESIPQDAALRLIIEGYSEDSDVGDYGSLTWTFTWK